MKRLGYMMIIMGAISIPLGYALLPVALRMGETTLSDGTVVISHPPTGFWVVIAGYSAALVLLASGLAVLRTAKSRREDT